MQQLARKDTPTKTRPNAKNVVDLILVSLVKNRGTAIWFEPIRDTSEAHRVTIERHRTRISSFTLEAGLGDAVLARLALLARLDLMATSVQNGRLAILVDNKAMDLLITVRPNSGGLSGEVRVLNSLGQEQDTEVAAQPDGKEYPSVLLPGTIVGSYRVEKQLGRGGMGIVYLVEHVQLRKRFAMKVLHKEVLIRDADAARRFVREALAAARVQHDGIVDVSDFGSFSDGRHYLVMELLDGRSLYDLMDEHGVVDLELTVRIMRDVAAALAAAHAAGIIHRDISPSNIFIESVGGVERIKIVDFGAASIPDADLKDVPDGPPGVVIGTPHYMSPEQVQALPTDARSDMYSFGAVLFQLSTGRVPFNGKSPTEIALQHIEEPLPQLSHEELPEELCSLINRLMAKVPEDRYATLDTVVAELDRVQALLTRRGWRKWLPS